jgi:hypothetical protein
MSPGLAGYSRTSLLAKAPSAASLDPMLSEQLQRRRALWSFLTWAFLLAEASRDSQADASAARLLDDPDWQQEPARGEAGAPVPLATDEPTLRDWSVPRAAEVNEPVLGSHGLPALPVLGRFDAQERLVDTAPPVLQSASGGGGSRGQAAHAESDATMQAADVRDGSPSDAGEVDVRSDGLVATGLDVGLDLPPASGFVEDLLARLPIDLEDAHGVLLPVGALTAAVTQVTGGLLALTKSLVGDALASGGSISLDTPQTRIDLGLDDLFASGRYTDYHLALQLEPLVVRSIDAAIADAAADTTLLDLLIPHVTTDHAPLSEAGGTAPPLGLPSVLDDLVQRTAVDLLM